jgi:hypothetical protein
MNTTESQDSLIDPKATMVSYGLDDYHLDRPVGDGD